MTKFLILIYGIVCYLLALATVLYAAGFEENLLVPKGIDGGTSEPLLVAIAIKADDPAGLGPPVCSRDRRGGWQSEGASRPFGVCRRIRARRRA